MDRLFNVTRLSGDVRELNEIGMPPRTEAILRVAGTLGSSAAVLSLIVDPHHVDRVRRQVAALNAANLTSSMEAAMLARRERTHDRAHPVSIDYRFEELRLRLDASTFAGMFDGRAEIDFWSREDFRVTRIVLDGDNGKFGRDAQQRKIVVDQGCPLFMMLIEALCEKADDIADEVERQEAPCA